MKDLSPIAFTSAVVGFPARLCVITLRSGPVIRAAESDTEITVSGDTFSVIPGFQISAIKHTNNGEIPSCEIVGVYGSGYTFDSETIDAGLYDAAVVQIYTVDRLNLTRKGLLFTGSISNITLDPIEHQVVFEVKGASASSRILMTQKRSPMCRTDLFSPLCQLVASSYDVAATVATIPTSFSFTVSGLAQADGYFNQGGAISAGGVAFVVANWVQSTQTVTTYLPCDRFLTVGQGVTLYPGCDKTDGAGGCGKFSNWINFQGENHWLGTAASAQQV